MGPVAEGHRHRRSWTSRSTGSGCRRACRRRPTTMSAPAAGWPSRPGPRPTSQTQAVRSDPGPARRTHGASREAADSRPHAAVSRHRRRILVRLRAGRRPARRDQRADDGWPLCFETAPLAGAARDPGRAGARARAQRRPAERVRGRAALRRRAGRRLAPRHLRPAQPHAIATATSIPSRSSPAGATASASSSTTSAQPSRRATASAWRSPPPTGRSPGPRPSR